MGKRTHFKIRFRPRYIIAVMCLFCVTLSLEAQAQNADPDSLFENSPFIPNDFNPGAFRGSKSAGGTPASYLQLIGIIELEDQYYFCLHNTRTGKSSWLGMEESWNEITLVDYDANEYSVLTRMGDSYYRVQLINASYTQTGNPLARLPADEVERRRRIFRQFSMISPDDVQRPPTRGVVRRNPRP